MSNRYNFYLILLFCLTICGKICTQSKARRATFKMFVYLSGPVTGIDDYAERFNKAQEAVSGKGYDPVSPISVVALRGSIFTWSDCMKVCISLMEKCDCMVMLDGWRTSVGARIEHAWAEKIGLPVYDGTDSLPNAGRNIG